MKLRAPISTMISSALFALAVGAAGERGTPAEARAMLTKAVAHYKSIGRKQALADFNQKKAPFGDRDLYVFCLSPDHTEIANGGFPSVVGTSGRRQGCEWQLPGQGDLDAVNKGESSVEYRWLNPVTGKTESKISFVEKAGDDVCGVGAYNPGK